MNAGTGLNGNSMGMSSIDCKAALNRACVHGVGASVPMGNDINEYIQRELQNTQQKADVGILNLKSGLQCKKRSRGLKTFWVKLNANSNQDLCKKKKKRRNYSYVQEFSILKKDYSRFRDLCISKFLNDNVKEHNELIE